MRPNRYVIFEDDFNGKQPLTERYTVDDTFGTVTHLAEGHSAEGGALALLADNSQADAVSVVTIDPLQFALSEATELDARFRLWSDDAVRVRIGFWQSATNFVVFEASTDLAGGGYALHANKSTVSTWDYHPSQIDAAWHTVTVRLLGTGLGAEAVIDGDETNKMAIANGDLPTGDQYGIVGYGETRGSSGVGSGEQRGVLINYWRAIQVR
jgi:hypothetical protein